MLRLTFALLATAEAVDFIGQSVGGPRVRTAEDAHWRLQNFWRLGEGFEGSASDYTEYVVWLIGVIAFLIYVGNPVRGGPCA